MKKVRLFVASPSELQPERERLGNVVNELNRSVCPKMNVVLEVVRWETHAVPDMGRVQGVINRQLGRFDIFVGILWKQFGTPTGEAQSGTEEEYRLAFSSWSNTGVPRIMFYFKQEPYVLTHKEEVEQLSKVIAFKKEFSTHGLGCDFNTLDEFEAKVREHLMSLILASDVEDVEPTEATLFRSLMPESSDLFRKAEVFDHLRHLLSHVIGEHADSVVKRLLAREEMMSTGVGFGFAYPHAYCPVLSRYLAGAIIIPNGCDWMAMDDQPVHAIVLCVSPRGYRMPQELRIHAAVHKRVIPVMRRPGSLSSKQALFEEVCGIVKDVLIDGRLSVREISFP
jgi:mannitol/fructose-specific phosphotransferase system IIA component (Ntr-type)